MMERRVWVRVPGDPLLPARKCIGNISATRENGLKFWEPIQDDEAQGVSEYAMLLVLLVLIVVATVHALGMNAQQVIDRVNTALTR
jgi:Flp pilus assembly pilin Flp